MKESTRILIVEDKSADADLAKRAIQKVLKDCEFQIVETYADFLNALEIFQPEVILSDYSLPRFDGMKALRLALKHAPLTPFIIWTGSISEDVAVECMKAGANNYILKDNIKRLGPALIHALEERQLLLERKQAEEALQNSEKRFRALIENGLDNISLLKADGTLIWESPATSRMLDYAPDQFIGHDIFDLMHPDDMDWTRDLYVKLIREPGSHQRGTFRLRRSDGTWRWVDAIVTNMLNEPSVNAIVVNYRDITEQKLAEEALRESQVKYQNLVETSHDLIWSVDAEGKITFLNHAAKEIYGYEPEDLIGRSFFEIMDPQYYHQDSRFFNEAIVQVDEHKSVESHVRHRDGREFILSANSLVIRDENGNVIGLTGTSHDITERKRMEEMLREERNLLRTLIDNIPDRIYAMDAQGRKTLSNTADWKASGGKTMEDVIGKTDFDAYPVELAESFWQIDKAVLDSGLRLINFEEPGLDFDGNRVSILTTKIPLRDDEGKVTGLVGIGRDITERKQSEARINDLLAFNEKILNYSPVGILTYKFSGECVFANENAASIAGTSVEVLMAQNFRTVESWKESGMYDLFEKAIATQAPVTADVHHSSAFGKDAWITAHCVTFKLKDENHILLSIADITERKQAEEALRESENRLILALSGAQMSVWEWNLQTNSILWSPEFFEITGVKEDDFGRTFESFTNLVHTEDVARVMASAEKAVTEKSLFAEEFRIIRPDGEVRWISNLGHAEYDSINNYLRLIGTVQDITLRKQAELERQALLEIMQGLANTTDLQELLELIHRSIAKVIYAQNFFVVLYNEKDGLFEEIYSVDQYDPPAPPSKLEKSITSYVFRSGKPLLLTQERFDELVEQGEVVLVGTNSASWLGVPLKTSDRTIGVIAVQDYENNNRYSERDREFVASIASQIALAINHRQAIEAVRESEIRYRGLFENLVIGFALHEIITDDNDQPVDYVFLEINPAFEKLTGVHADEAIGKSVKEILPGTDNERFIQIYGRVALTGIPVHFEEFSEALGKHYEINAYSPKRGQFAVTFTDITERKQATERIRNAREFLRGVQNSLSAHIAILDQYGTIVQTNTAWRVFGEQNGLNHPEHGVGLNYLEICNSATGPDAEEAPLVANAILDVIAGRRNEASVEYPCHGPEQKRWFTLRITKFENEEGTWIILAHENITERKHAENALHESEALYRQAIEIAGAVPYYESYYDEGRLIKYEFIGEGIRQITGYGPEEFSATVWDSLVEEVNLVEDLAGYSLEDAIQQVRMGENSNWKCEHRLRDRDGKIHWVFEAAVELRDENGVAYGSIGTYQDITKRKLAEEAEREQRALAEALRDTAETLSSSLSYEEVLDHILAAVGRVVPHEAATIMLIEGESARVVRSYGYDKRGFDFEIMGIELPLAETNNLRQMFETGKTVVVHDTHSFPGWMRLTATDWLRSNVGAPISVQGKVIGFILLDSRTPGFFTPVHAERLEAFANQAALAIHNSHLLKQAQEEITERKRAEEALRAEREKAQNYLDIAGVIMLALDQNGIVTLINQKGCEILGYPADEIIGKDWIKSFLPKTVQEELQGVFHKLISDDLQSAGYYENKILTKNGEERLIAWHNTQVRDSQGTIISTLSSGEDITERKRAEAQLRVSEERFRQLADNIQEVFWMTDAQSGEEIYISPAAEMIWERPTESLMHEPNVYLNSIFPEDQPALLRAMEREKNGEKAEIEYRIIRPDGSIRWVWDRGFPIFDDSGKVIRIAGITADITERRESELALVKSQSRYRELFHSSPISIWEEDYSLVKKQIDLLIESGVTDLKEYFSIHPNEATKLASLVRVTDINKASLELYQVEHKEDLLDSLSKVMGSESLSHFEEEILGLMSPLKRFVWEGADKTISGRQMEVIVNGSIPEGYEEDWSKVIVSIIDITDRREAEQQLRKLSRAVEQSASTIVITDLDGNIEYVNPKFTEITGYTFEEALGQNPRILKSGFTSDELYKQLWQMVASGKEWHGELLNRKKNNELFWEYVTISPILNERGQITHFVGVKEDITQHKQNEIELRRRAQETSALLQTSLALTNLDLQATLQTIGNSAKTLFVADGCRIFLMQPDGESMHCVLALQENSDAFSDLRIKSGEGVTGAVAASGRAEIVNEMQNDPRGMQVPGTLDKEEEAIMFAPLKERDRTIGVLSVRRAGIDRPFRSDDLELLEAFASMAASAVSNARLFEETQHRLTELEALYENGLAVGRLLKPSEIGNRMINTFTHYLQWHHVTIRLRKEASDDLDLVAFHLPGLKDEEKAETELHFSALINKVGQGLSGWVIQTGMPYRTGNVHTNSQYIDTHPGIKSGLYMPLRVGEQVIGVISVESKESDAFTEQDERLLATLANQAATAFENARLYETIQKELAERKRMEHDLRSSEVHYRELADSITDILFEMDQDLRYSHWNKASELFSGIPAKDAIGRSMQELFGASEDQLRQEEIYKGVLREQRARTFEVEAFSKGQKQALEINAYPSGRGVSVVAKDITDRKRTETIMQKRFELMEFSAHHALDELMQRTTDEVSELTGSSIGFFHFVEENQTTLRMQTWSTSALQLFHVPLSEGVHLPLDQAGVWAEAARQRRPLIQNDYESLPKRRGLPQGHVPITREMVIPIIRNERIMAIMGIGNKPQNYTQSDLEIAERLADYAWDITERKQMEMALEAERNQLAQRVAERTADLSRANSNLARALRVKDEFLANMSHELRTPLNAILGLSESLGEQIAGPLNEKQQKYIATIGESGHHLLSLINDILDLAKIDAGQITLDINKVDIHSVCQASLRMIKQLAQKKNQEVSLEVDEGLGLMWADERRLKQMIVNLLGNAVKFTPENGKLGLEVHGDEDANKISFTVWDKGIGIKEEDLARLFQPFVQLDSGLARETTGTGLGLALVAQMARLHGGSITTASEPENGSRFTIVLPWEPALAMDAAARMKITGKFRAIKLDEKNKPIILLVEDTKEVTMMIRDYLELTGYKVVTAQDGVDAMVQAKLVRPDLILMDIQMPRMDGLEATRKLRSEPDFRYTPIIALTALAMPSDRERCLEAGMDEYISKPVNLKALVKIIQGCLFSNQEIKSR